MSYKHMDFFEIKQLKIGDSIYIRIINAHNKINFIKAIVTRPLFWNSDADEPDWEVETNNGFVDIYSIFQINALKNVFLADLMMEQREQM